MEEASTMNNNVYIVWGENNNLGIHIIDEQHKGIVSLINSLHFSIIEKYSNELLKPIAESIKDYTTIHFQTEQHLLQKTNYQELPHHLELHKELIVQTIHYTQQANEHNDPIILLKFLREWWLNHINIEDRKYVSHVSNYLT